MLESMKRYDIYSSKFSFSPMLYACLTKCCWVQRPFNSKLYYVQINTTKSSSNITAYKFMPKTNEAAWFSKFSSILNACLTKNWWIYGPNKQLDLLRKINQSINQSINHSRLSSGRVSDYKYMGSNPGCGEIGQSTHWPRALVIPKKKSSRVKHGLVVRMYSSSI